MIGSIHEKGVKYQEALDTYQNTKENALQVIKCLENLEADEILENSTVQIQPAETMKETISKDFQTLATNAADLLTLELLWRLVVMILMLLNRS